MALSLVYSKEYEAEGFAREECRRREGQGDIMKDYIEHLWEKFLLSSVSADIMLGEAADRMGVDLRGCPGRHKEDLLSYAVLSGFSDTIEEAADHIFTERKAMRPWSELADVMTADALMDRLYEDILRHTTCYDSRTLRNNPYYQAVPMTEARSGSVRLSSGDYLAGEFFQTWHHSFDASCPFAYGSVGFFDKPVQFPVILEKDRLWMSIVMSEIESMKEGVKAAKGRVITYGLGLGYYAFMAAEKEDVEEVTAVELNPHVAELFQTYILPHFPNRRKIRIIQDDAYHFIRQQKDGDYDFAYADFWAGIHDGPALWGRLLPMTKHFQKTKWAYWIENCFIDQWFRPAMMAYFMDTILSRQVKLPEVPKDIRKEQRAFQNFLKGKEIHPKTPEEADALLQPKTLTALVRRFEEEKEGREK